ncbi:MAG: aldehyde ferredoxin oxidoreductase family protein [Eubacteriales bacterium]|jgi:aldehyde:ferredoxin oxidoreductase|nr:aldehyde ferredoxin oxidoreductase family protein [Eubacteriales bacterium]
MRTPVYAIIDLNTRTSERYEIEESMYRKYIGGKMLGARLLYDLTPAGIDPLGPDAVVIINTSPANGTGAPCSSRFNMTFKNVLTGGIASSNCGGQFGVLMKRAGYDGIILRGQSDMPCVISIVDKQITITDAGELWGKDTEETQQAFPKIYGKLVIGPAGEHLVRYAAAVSGERVAGRCGAGAVLGAKKIKAIVAYGTQRPQIHNKKKFAKYVSKWVKFLRNHPMTGEALPNYGSAGLVSKANATNALPTHNFKYGHFKDANAVSGETLADTRLLRNSSCISCPIRCERRVSVDGKDVKGPEYETCGFFGPNIDCISMESLLRLNYQCDLLGLDTISLASTLAFAMELKENGVADFDVSFGNSENLTEIVERIAVREGKYSDLANGSKWLSEKYGGKEYAMHSKGLELASYEPRSSVGMGLGYATSNRGGCHLNGGYLALLESVGVLSMNALSTSAKPAFTAFFQNALEAISASGFCLFSAQSFVPAILFKLGPHHRVTRAVGKIATHLGFGVRALLWMLPILRFNTVYLFPHAETLRLITGLPFYTGSFVRLGERGYNMERLYNFREGLTGKDDSLPDRLTKTPQDANNPKTVVRLDQMLPVYYKIRAWDETGAPRKRTLRKLGIKA